MGLLDQIRSQLANVPDLLEVGPARPVWGTTGTLNVPASTVSQANVVNVTTEQFRENDGIYIESLFGSIRTGDTTGNLQITDLHLCIVGSNNPLAVPPTANPLMELGTPIITTLFPRNGLFGSSLLFQPQPLIVVRTMQLLSAIRAAGMIIPSNLAFQLAVEAVNIDAVGAHSWRLEFGMLYRHVRGLREG